MTLSLIFDVAVCVFLLAGFFYTLWFNRRLIAAHNSRQQFQNLLDMFSNALERGQNSLAQLQEMNARISSEMDLKMSSATSLIEDLRFFSDRGESIMSHLENHVRLARSIKQDFEHLIHFHEHTSSLASAKPEAQVTSSESILREKNSRLDRLQEETIFKTDARIDHPWGTLRRKNTPGFTGGPSR